MFVLWCVHITVVITDRAIIHAILTVKYAFWNICSAHIYKTKIFSEAKYRNTKIKFILIIIAKIVITAIRLKWHCSNIYKCVKCTFYIFDVSLCSHFLMHGYNSILNKENIHFYFKCDIINTHTYTVHTQDR